MLTDVAALPEQSTKDSNGSVDAHKRHFLQTFRRWEVLFKRKDGDVQSDKWLIAEYYKSLGHLSEAGLDVLTDALKETCVFFPTIKECLDLTRPKDRYDWAHPFLNKPHLMRAPASAPLRLTPPAEQIGYDE